MSDFEVRIIKYNKSLKNSTVLRDITTALESVFGEQYEVIHDVDRQRIAINVPNQFNLPEGTDEGEVDESEED